MRFASSLVAAPLLALAGLLPTPAASAPPPRGPGAVLDCVHRILEAAATGDRATIEKLFVAYDQCYAVDGRGEGQMLGADQGELAFVDVGADGNTVEARDRRGAVDLLITAIGGADRKLRTEVVRSRADCPSAGCSWAVIDVERSFERDGKTVRQPLRITALARYGGDVEHMRIYSWHCSPLASNGRSKVEGAKGGGR